VVEIQEIEGVNYLPINFLLGYICKGSSSRDLKIRAFALILYGVVLFPKISGFVDEYAIKVFERELHGVNPTFAIISETFAAMDKCYLESEMTMYGSTSLLVIWIFGHLRPSPVMGIPYARYSMAFDMSTSTIREFIEARGEYLKTTREQWREYFSRLDGKSINWRATWMPIMNILYRCGSNFWVSLLGPRGCIGYAPSMFRRQVECWQFIPPIRGMRESNFRYSDADCWGKFQRAVSSWKSPRKIRHSLIYRETLAVQDRVANDYPAWQQKRAKMPAQIFYDRNCKRKIGTSDERMDKVNSERYAELEAKLEKLQLENKKLIKEKDQQLDRYEVERREVSGRIRSLERQAEENDRTVVELHNQIEVLGKNLEMERKSRDELEETLAKGHESFERKSKYMTVAKKVITESAKRARYLSENLSLYMEASPELQEEEGLELWNYLTELEEELAYYGRCSIPE
ncbi:hypothetical protein LINPERHAP1_LOCUS7743, partial [Linum perenne]